MAPSPLTKEDLRDRIKEIEARIAQLDRREKAVSELKQWLAKRGLDHGDMLWLYRKISPQRADKPVKSKKSLQPKKQALAALLKAKRAERGLSVVEMAKKSGIPTHTIYNWEAANGFPGEDYQKKIAKFFDLPPDLGLSKPPPAGANGRAHD